MKLCPSCQAEYSDDVRYCPRDGAQLLPVPGEHTTQEMYDPLLGETLEERYRIQARLGKGGLAPVYAAEHVLIERPVAVKVLDSCFLHEREVVERFLREARSASRLRHPNIVSITDFGRTPGGAPFFVMDRVGGPSLGEVLADGGRLPIPRALEIAVALASALEHAHRQGIIHRDVKPDNVLLQPLDDGGERPMLVDFGLARCSWESRQLTQAGQVLGSPHYMAPEQAAGETVDERADVFALGVVLYRMLSGRLPFQGERPLEVLSSLLSGPPPSLAELEPERVGQGPLSDLVHQTLRRERDKRPASMGELREKLEAIASGSAPMTARSSGGAAPPAEGGEEPPPRPTSLELAPTAAHDVDEVKRLAELDLSSAAETTQAATPFAEAPSPPGATPDAPAQSEITLQDERLRPRRVAVRSTQRLAWGRLLGLVAVGLLAMLVGVLAGRGMTTRDASRKPSPNPHSNTPTPRGEAPPTMEPRVQPRPAGPIWKIRLESVPLGASVDLDGRPAGQTPVTVQIPGKHREMVATFRKKGYLTVSRIVRANSGSQLRVWLPRALQRRAIVGQPRPRTSARVMRQLPPRPRSRLGLPDLELKDPFSGSKR